MTDVWRCAVCEGVNTASTSCTTCGAPRSMATSSRAASPAPAATPAFTVARPSTAAQAATGETPLQPTRATRPSRAVGRVVDVARVVSAARAERVERVRSLVRERRAAELYADRESDMSGYHAEPERPRLRVTPLPGGCLFSVGPRRRRRTR
jgi:hypothetical protein